MTKHQIVIEIHPGGKIIAEARGIKGPKCGMLTKWLEKLGIVREDKSTREIYEKEQEKVVAYNR